MSKYKKPNDIDIDKNVYDLNDIHIMSYVNAHTKLTKTIYEIKYKNKHNMYAQKNKKKAVKAMRDILIKDYKKIHNIDDNDVHKITHCDKMKLIHGEEYFVYIINKLEYFDLKHILHTMFNDIKITDYDKYVTKLGYQKNEYDGYNIRKLISREDLFKIAKKKSKNDDNYVDFEEYYSQKKGHNYTDLQLDKYLMKCQKNCDEIDDNDDETTTLLKELFQNAKNIKPDDYALKHIIYLCIMPFRDIEKNKSSLKLKPGYTFDNNRKLENDHKCKSYQIAIKPVIAEQEEKQFHSKLQNKYPDLHCPTKISDKNKIEMYEFDERIIDEFNNFESDGLKELENKKKLKKYDKIKKENEKLKKDKAKLKEENDALIKKINEFNKVVANMKKTNSKDNDVSPKNEPTGNDDNNIINVDGIDIDVSKIDLDPPKKKTQRRAKPAKTNKELVLD